MADVFDRAKRSEIMARIRGRENAATELRMIRLFRENGIAGWRRNYPLFGKPDFVFTKQRLAVFVDGDFWHGHPKRRMPASNVEFWAEKIARNKARDRLVVKCLRAKGWRVLRIWQSSIQRNPRAAAKRLIRSIEI
jgi:DNA mismatch endonuclease (patch repair protein)